MDEVEEVISYRSAPVAATSFFGGRATTTPRRPKQTYGQAATAAKKRKLAVEDDEPVRRDAKGRGTVKAAPPKRAKATPKPTTPVKPRARGKAIKAPAADSVGPDATPSRTSRRAVALDEESPVTPTKSRRAVAPPPTPPPSRRAAAAGVTPRKARARTVTQLPTPTATPTKSKSVDEREDEEQSDDEVEQSLLEQSLLAPTAPPAGPSHVSMPPRKEAIFPTDVALPRLRSLFPVLSTNNPLPLRFEDAPAVDATVSLETRRQLIAQTPCLPGLGDYERDVRTVVGRSVWEGEGNAMILVGGRGSGKSAIVSRALDFVRSPRVGGSRDSLLLIRLNGLVHTTDRLALRELARQLFVGGFDAGNDVAARILHDAAAGAAEGGGEGDEEEEEDGDPARLGSYADTLNSLLGALEPDRAALSSGVAVVEDEAPRAKTKPLVIVLDEFDLFTERARQSFLYTLLDVVQGNRRRGGMCVIGLTPAAVVLEQLEKRVKSRCQSRIHYIAAPGRDAPQRTEICTAVLALPPSDEVVDAFASAWDEQVSRFVQDKRTQAWLENIWTLKAEGVPKVLHQLHRMLASALRTSADTIDLSSILDPSRLPLSAGSGAPARDLLAPLGAVDVSVVIAARHLTLAGDAAVNFELCHDAYRKHARRTADESGVATQLFTRDQLAMAWDRLQRMEIVLPFSTTARGGGGGGRAFRMFKLVPWTSHVDQEVERRDDLPRHLKAWCKNASA